MVTEIWMDGKNVMGKIKVLETPSGKILKELVNGGVTVEYHPGVWVLLANVKVKR